MSNRQRAAVYTEIGERGRRTGYAPPKNLAVDKDGLEDISQFFSGEGEAETRQPQPQQQQRADEAVVTKTRKSVGTRRKTVQNQAPQQQLQQQQQQQPQKPQKPRSDTGSEAATASNNRVNASSTATTKAAAAAASKKRSTRSNADSVSAKATSTSFHLGSPGEKLLSLPAPPTLPPLPSPTQILTTRIRPVMRTPPTPTETSSATFDPEVASSPIKGAESMPSQMHSSPHRTDMDQYAVSSHYELPESGPNPTRSAAPATTESPAVSPVQYDMHTEHQLVASPSPKRARDSRRKVFDLSGTGDDDVDIDDAAIDESVAIDTHQDTNDDGNDWVTATQHVDVGYDINVDEEEVDVEIEQRSQKQKQQQKKPANKQAPARRSVKSTTTTAAVSKATQARARSRKPTASAEHLISSDEEEDDDGGSKVRRSARTRTRPLEFWRNERPVYKLVYDPKTKGKVPVLKTIEGANQDISSKSENNQQQQQQLQSQRRQQKQSTAASKISKKATTTTTTSTKRQTKSTRVVVENEPAEYDNVADVDEYDNVDANAQLDDIEEVDESEDEEQTLKKRRRKSNEGANNATTAVPTELPYLIEDDTGQYTESNAKLVDVVTSQKFRETTGDCKYHSGLEVAGYLSSGVIQIPVGGYKPAKKPVNCALLGHVVQGKVQVTIHRTAVEIGVGCSFVVPPGNPFQIKNVSQKAAKVLLVQTTPHTS